MTDARRRPERSGTIYRQTLTLAVIANLLLATMIVYGYLWNSGLATKVAHTDEISELTKALTEAQQQHVVIEESLEHRAWQGKAVGGLDDAVNHFAATLTEARRLMARLHREDAQHMDTVQQHFATLDTLLTESAALHPQLLELAARADRGPLGTLLHERFFPLSERINTHFGPLTTALTAMVHDHNEEVREKLATNRILWISAGILLMAGSLLATMLFTRRVIQPIHRLTEGMAAIVQGEARLDERLPEGRGELGQLACHYNSLITKVQAAVLQIAEVGGMLTNSSHELTSAASSTKMGLEGQRREVEDAIQRMQTLESEITDVESGAAEAAHQAEASQQESRQGQEVMRDTLEAMERLDRETLHAAESINEVVARAEDIDTIIQVIHAVAEQTNLLALNAAIEAARAGEQGRGFAVVADEVRSLAAKTRASVDEITTLINALKGSVSQSNESMEGNRAIVTEAVQRVEGMAETLNHIDDANRRIADKSAAIAQGVGRQTELAADINRNAVNLSMTTVQAESNATLMDNLGHSLEDLVDRLNLAIGTFHAEQDLVQLRAAQAEATQHASPAAAAPTIDAGDTGDVELF